MNTLKNNIVDHPGAVAIIAIKNEEIILIKQYRESVKEILFEIPAGKVEKNETLENAAIREMYEETGYKINSLKKIGTYITTPGFSNQRLTIFYTDDFYKVNDKDVYGADLDEEIHVEILSVKQFLKLIDNHLIVDFKTVFAGKVLQ